MRKRLWVIAGLVAGCLIAWLVLRSGAVTDSIGSVRHIDWQVLILALGAVLFAALLESYRWKLLLPSENISLARLFWVRNVGRGLNNISPVRVVGEVAETAMLRYTDGIVLPKVVSSLMMARLLDLLVTMNLVGLGLILLPQLAGLKPVVAPLWGISFLALAGILLMGKRLHRIPGVQRIKALEALAHSAGILASNRRLIVVGLVLTATAWMSIGTASWLIAQAAGIDLPFWLMCIVIVSVTLFTSATPAPPGAVGVYEFGVITTLGLFTVDPAVALTFALVIHALLFLPSILIAAVVLVFERGTFRQVADAVALAMHWGPRSLVAPVPANVPPPLAPVSTVPKKSKVS